MQHITIPQGVPVSAMTSTRDLLRNVAQVIVVLAGLNSGYKAIFGSDLTSLLIKDETIRRILLGIVGGAAVLLTLDALVPKPKAVGPCVFPRDAVADKLAPSQPNLRLMLQTAPEAKIVYWITDQPVHSPDTAPQHNVGVTTANQSGVAMVDVRMPIQRTLRGNTTPLYLQYRFSQPESTEFSQIYTLVLQ